jgi:hypothetical protein
MPWRVALREELRRHEIEVGPLDFLALARLAATFFRRMAYDGHYAGRFWSWRGMLLVLLSEIVVNGFLTDDKTRPDARNLNWNVDVLKPRLFAFSDTARLI